MSMRPAISVALLASAALALTACGPDDSSTNANPAASSPAAASSAPAAPSGKPSGAATKSPAPGASKGSNGDCPTLASGHKYIWVDHLEGAMNNVVAADAQAHCDPAMNEGAAYSHGDKLTTYGLSLDAKITVITQAGKETVVASKGGISNGIAHVKACADPNGSQYMGTKKPADYFCAGQNFFDVVIDSHNTITEMTELYGS